MVMPGYVNYFYKDGHLPAHTKDSFEEYNILTVHGIIVKYPYIKVLMHRMKYFPDTVPSSIRNLFPDNMPTYGSDHENSIDWSEKYGGRNFQSSIFFNITHVNV